MMVSIWGVLAPACSLRVLPGDVRISRHFRTALFWKCWLRMRYFCADLLTDGHALGGVVLTLMRIPALIFSIRRQNRWYSCLSRSWRLFHIPSATLAHLSSVCEEFSCLAWTPHSDGAHHKVEGTPQRSLPR